MLINPDDYTVRMVAQVDTHDDCAVAALAMFAGRTYAEALSAFPKPALILKRGAYWPEVRAAATKLGLTTSLKRVYNLDIDTGLLYLESRKVKDDDHMVYLWAGRILDNNVGWLQPSAYLLYYDYNPKSLLIRL